mmetsp:Transcript_8224/g.12239  ORF Transcript_8224/g.12239 Transcript_8224/m.12239 type:complete len:275 (-) Transcript_8224:128-952(-)
MKLSSSSSLLLFAPVLNAAAYVPTRNDRTKQRFSSFSATNEKDRRNFFTSTVSASLAIIGLPQIASATEDPLFKKNPLTNKFLEQVRILEQAEADNVQYSGELAPGGTANKNVRQSNYATLLKPLIIMRDELSSVDALIHSPDGVGPALDEAQKVLSGKSYEKINFKRSFNMFADNIYYTDPDRANAYLGGGATPRNEQSIAYLVRNDILNNLESLQAEVSYLIKERNSGEEKLETDDLYEYSRKISKGFQDYLALVPPAEIEAAMEMIRMEKN